MASASKRIRAPPKCASRGALLETIGRLGYERGHLRGIRIGRERQKTLQQCTQKSLKLTCLLMQIDYRLPILIIIPEETFVCSIFSRSGCVCQSGSRLGR